MQTIRDIRTILIQGTIEPLGTLEPFQAVKRSVLTLAPGRSIRNSDTRSELMLSILTLTFTRQRYLLRRSAVIILMPRSVAKYLLRRSAVKPTCYDVLLSILTIRLSAVKPTSYDVQPSSLLVRTFC